MYLHERQDWPEFRWNEAAVAVLLAEVRHLQGRLLGRMEGLGFQLREEATLQTSNSRRGFLGRPGFPVLSRGELAAWGGEGIAEVAIVRWCVFMLADTVGRARRPSDTLVLYWKSFGFVRAALSYPLGTVGTSTN